MKLSHSTPFYPTQHFFKAQVQRGERWPWDPGVQPTSWAFGCSCHPDPLQRWMDRRVFVEISRRWRKIWRFLLEYGYEWIEKWMKNGTSMDNGNRKMEDQWIFMDINGNIIAESHMGIKGLTALVRLVLLQALLIRREPHNCWLSLVGFPWGRVPKFPPPPYRKKKKYIYTRWCPQL